MLPREGGGLVGSESKGPSPPETPAFAGDRHDLRKQRAALAGGVPRRLRGRPQRLTHPAQRGDFGHQRRPVVIGRDRCP